MTSEAITANRNDDLVRQFALRHGITLAVAAAILKNADRDIDRAKAAVAKMRG